MKYKDKLSIIMSILLLTTISSGIVTVSADLGDVVEVFDSPGYEPTGLCWDGYYFWNADRDDDMIYQCDPVDFSVVSSIGAPGDNPRGVTWDGSNLWHVDFLTHKLYKLNPSNGNILQETNIISNPSGITFDGTYLWISSTYEAKIYQYTTSGGYIDSFDSPALEPVGLVWDDSDDGPFLWVSNDGSGDDPHKISKVDPSTGVELDFFYAPHWCPMGLALDDDFLYNADYDGNGKIYQLEFYEPDTDPPTPNPPNWEVLPHATGQSSIEMKVAAVNDPSGGVQYYFEETTGHSGGSNSGWQSSQTYIDDGLSPDTQYTYRVKSRDSLGNTGSYSAEKSATTNSNQPNNPPNQPNKPTGPEETGIIFSCEYWTSTTDDDGDQIRYGWDWDDGSQIEWTGYKNSGDRCYKSHSWDVAGIYEIKVIADDGEDQSSWSEILTVTVTESNAPSPPQQPNGETQGIVNVDYIYSTKTTDPNGYVVNYGWDWDNDDEVDEWTGFYSSSTLIETVHSWTEPGTYIIKVKAKNIFEIESPFSQPLTVNIDPEFLNKIFDGPSDVTKQEQINDFMQEPEEFSISFDNDGKGANAQVKNENDIYIPQSNIGEAYFGYEYTVPERNAYGRLHQARLTVNGQYWEYLEIGGFGQIADIKIDLIVEEHGSDYMRTKEVYSNSLSGWSVDYLINEEDDVLVINDYEDLLGEDASIWLNMYLREGYTYTFWVKLTCKIVTTGLPGKVFSFITQQPAPDLMGFAESNTAVSINYLKLEWMDNLLFGSSGDNNRPDIPNLPLSPSDEYIVGEEIEFSTTVSDPDGDTLYCKYYWGDGTSSNWLGPYTSGESSTKSHVFDQVGTYFVNVEVKDSNGVHSGFSHPQSIYIDIPPGNIEFNSPSGEDIEWKKNKNYEISWNTDGNVGKEIRVNLVKYIESDDVYEVVQEIAVVDSDVTSCTCTPTVSEGVNYYIMLHGKNSCSLAKSDPISIVKESNRGRFNIKLFELFEHFFNRLFSLFNLFDLHSNI